MARIQDVDLPYLEFGEAAAPGTPASGIVRIYAKADGTLYSKDDAGAETSLGGGGAAAPDDAFYLVTSSNGTLSNEVVVRAPAANGVVPVVKYKASNESVSNTTLQNDDDLTFPIGASEVWVVDYFLFTDNAANTGDIKLLPSVPAGATVRYGGIGPVVGSTSAEADARIQTLSDGTTALPFGVVSAATEDFISFHVLVVNSTNAGNVVLQWAQNSTDGSNATILLAGSHLIAHRVA